jgi:hypothetical protein
MTGDGSDTTLALTNAPVNENATFVTIDGVAQHKSTYSVSGTTLTFSTAPPTGSAVEAITLNTTTINTASILQDADGDTKVQVEESSDEDKIRFDTAGTERAVIDSSGLDVTGTVTADALTVNSGTTNTVATFQSTDSTVVVPFIDSVGSTQIRSIDGAFAIRTGGDGGSTANTAEAMRIDSSGNVGIGTSSPTGNLEIATSASDAGVDLVLDGNKTSNGGIGSIIFNNNGDSVGMIRSNRASANDAADMLFYTQATGGANTERMRLDSNGNLLVGKTTTSSSTAGMLIGSNGRFDAVRDGGYVGYFNRLSTDGDIALFAKDGTTVGSITANSGSGGFLGIKAGGSNELLLPLNSTPPRIQPSVDNSFDIGTSSARFDDIYATNGTIQTSDRNEKQDIEALSDAEQRVAVAAKGLLRKFRWKSSVEENGDDARIHFGIIAQDLQAAFEAEGLDAGRYAMFISDTWTDEEAGEERTRLGVRYSELLAFIISAI